MNMFTKDPKEKILNICSLKNHVIHIGATQKVCTIQNRKSPLPPCTLLYALEVLAASGICNF